VLLALPVATFLCFFLILREMGFDWRKGVLASAILEGASVVVITEVLSVPRLITRGGVAIAWLVICVVGLLYLRMLKRRAPHFSPSGNPSGERLDTVTKGLIVASGIIVLLVGLIAVIAAPSIWDAMEYHLPRVVMWISNHSVRFYPTPDFCQLVFGPWAEYAMMHTYLLWGSDRFVNFVQFFSFVGSIIGVSLVAQKLGAGLRGQVLAAVVCATIPEGVLEASGPKNTYVVTFWIVTTVAFLLEWNDDPSWFNAVCVGLAAGLGLLTKGTAYVYLPFLMLACWWMGSRSVRILFLKRCSAFLILILALNAPQYIRCYELSGSPLGLPLPVDFPRIEVTVAHVTVRGTLANVLRNISLHLGTPSESINLKTERMFRLAIRGLGADPDDPREIWFPGEPFRVNKYTLGEVLAGDPLHLALLLAAIGMVIWKRDKGPRRSALWYALGMVASFTFFCATLRWTMWSSRYHLTLFALGAALSGFVLERYFSRRLGNVVGILLLAYAVPFAIANHTRSLIPWSRVDDVYHPRSLLYFNDQHENVAQANIAAAEAVNGLDCGSVGIDSYLKDSAVKHSPKSLFVYPVLAMIHADGRTRSVWYMGVNNLTTRYANQSPHPAPCAVICLECARVPAKWAEYRNVGGRASVFDHIVVFSSSGTTLNTGAPDLQTTE
jgi:hypothetical protein